MARADACLNRQSVRGSGGQAGQRTEVRERIGGAKARTRPVAAGVGNSAVRHCVSPEWFGARTGRAQASVEGEAAEMSVLCVYWLNYSHCDRVR